MKNLVMYKKGKNSFARFILKRLKNNLNFMGLFFGETGSGKTWSAISLSQSIDPDFEVRQIAFDFKEMMSIINADWFKAKKKKIIVFDEPQISISNRTWQSLTNKLMNYLVSTFRHQNIIVFFCCPYQDFLDSASMKLLHATLECVAIDKKKKLCIVKPLLPQYNSRMKKYYYHAVYVIRDGGAEALRMVGIKKPTDELIKQYEQRKEMFTSALNKSIEEQLEQIDKPKAKERREIELTLNQEDIENCWKEGMFKQKDIAEKLGKVSSQICVSIKSMRKKGYSPRDYAKTHENSKNIINPVQKSL